MKLLGDPHLGRSFIHGVPLDRRGERERMVNQQFLSDIMTPSGGLHVCMGDLFDKAIVPYSVILNTALAYAAAAQKFPNTKYVILKGNHDWQRDLEKPSAFDLFHRMVNHINNIFVVTTTYQIGRLAFFAWHPTINAVEMVRNGVWDADVALGHWDIEDFGGDNMNLIPTQALAEAGVKNAFTGHIHKPQEFVRDNVNVVVVGSMQPYAHGEEIDETLYKTIDKKALLESPVGAWHNHCLRVDLSAGDILDIEVDCLQLTVRKEKEDGKPMEVTLGDFNMTELFRSSFTEAGVSDKITDTLLGRYEASRMTND